MRRLIKFTLLLFGLIFILSTIESIEGGNSVALLNTGIIIIDNNTSVLNSTNENLTAQNTTDSIPEDDKSGSIASLPGKCLGSALCPD
jgi:hypothetical protein